MRLLGDLFEQNREWAERIRQEQPNFFEQLAKQQAPKYLWIGCSDSRVPANQIVGMLPGELFVHRNVANLVIHTDLNCLSVIQYAVDVLSVRHIIVCGHYGCGGVRAAMETRQFGLIDNWLLHLKDIYRAHSEQFDRLAELEDRFNRFCEINVIEQVLNVCNTTVVRGAWERGQDVAVHGWIYGVEDGRLRDLGLTVTAVSELESVYRNAIES